MRKLKPAIRLPLCLILLAAIGFPSTGYCQEDPFGNPGGSPDDPFAERPVDPKNELEAERAATTEAERAATIKAMDDKSLRVQVEYLKQALKESHVQSHELRARYVRQLNSVEDSMAVYENKIERLHQLVGSLKHKIDNLESRTTLNAPAHDELIRSLINSGDNNQQETGLKYLAQLAQANDPDGPKAFKLDSATSKTLETLLTSDYKPFRQLSALAIANHDPEAIQKGFQLPSSRWKPIPTGNQLVEKIRHALNRDSDFDYFESRLEDVVAEIQSEYQIPVRFFDVDREILVTFKARKLRLGTALHDLLSEHKLMFTVQDDQLKILAADEIDNAVSSITWNVRSLLTDEMKMDGLISLLDTRFDSQSSNIKLESLDQYRLLTIANEHQQDQISQFLAAQAKHP